MSESKSWSIISRAVAAILAAAGLWGLSKIPGLLHWLGKIGIAFWTHLKGTSGLPNWGLYLLILMAIHTLVTLAKRLKKPKGPKVTEYNQDIFLGLLWRWSYIGNHPINAWALCPHCKTILVYTEHRDYPFSPVEKTVLTCETCNREMLTHPGDKDYLVGKIHRQIDRKIRTGEWIKSLTEKSA